jgi:hypothetical protein
LRVRSNLSRLAGCSPKSVALEMRDTQEPSRICLRRGSGSHFKGDTRGRDKFPIWCRLTGKERGVTRRR